MNRSNLERKTASGVVDDRLILRSVMSSLTVVALSVFMIRLDRRSISCPGIFLLS